MTNVRDDRARIEPGLLAFIAEEFLLDAGGVDLTPDYRLIDEGVIDSMGIFRLISFLEDEHGVSVEPGEVVIDNFATVAAIARMVARKTGGDV